MFDTTSRYAGIETATARLAGGRDVVYVRRRFLPDPAGFDELARVVVDEADRGRIDLLAARTIGDSEQYWRLCDANLIAHPDELTSTVGRVVTVAAPRLGGTP